jgi:hypothetical protein
MFGTIKRAAARLGRLFRFRLRTLFVLTTLVAAVVTWTTLTMQRLERQEQAIAWFEEAARGRVLYFDYELDDEGDVLRKPTPPETSWLHYVFGPQWSVEVARLDSPPPPNSRMSPSTPRVDLNDRDLEHIESLPNLRWLVLQHQS